MIRSTYLHVVKNGCTESNEIAMIKDIQGAPPILTNEFTPGKLRMRSIERRGRILLHEFVAGRNPPRDAITMRIHVRRYQSIWKTQQWCCRRRRGRAIGCTAVCIWCSVAIGRTRSSSARRTTGPAIIPLLPLRWPLLLSMEM